MNAAVRLVTELGRRDHVTESMKSLHCTGFRYNTASSLSCGIKLWNAANGTSPAYITDLVLTRKTHGLSHIRSVAAGNYDVPWFHSEFFRRAFSVAAPSEWNSIWLAVPMKHTYRRELSARRSNTSSASPRHGATTLPARALGTARQHFTRIGVVDFIFTALHVWLGNNRSVQYRLEIKKVGYYIHE